MEKKNDDFLKASEDRLIFKKYKPIKRIGEGSFSQVYICIDNYTNKLYSMKVEKRNAQILFLETEAIHLFSLQGKGIPKYITCGRTKDYNILIEELLGKSLLNIAQKIQKGLELKDICLCALQALERIEWIHSKDLIHRDIKPENFLFGIDNPNIIYIVDFGLSKKYRSSKTGKHMMPKFTGKFNGTVRYASANSLKGKECSRRDDLISMGYMLLYLKYSHLSWADTLY